MDPLATLGDLAARNIDASDPAATMLAVASSAVRGAAGSPISQVTSTIRYTGWWTEKWLRLAGPPVTAVATVEIDGEAVTDCRLANSRLWRAGGWGCDGGPSDVDVVQTHGLLVVPAEIVDLVCAFTAAGIEAAKEGYADALRGGKIAERIDDYSVSWAQGAEAVATAMELPAGTRQWLSSMFGGSAAVVATR